MSFNKKIQSIGLFGRNYDYDLSSFNQLRVFHSFKRARALTEINTCIIDLCLKWTFNSNDWKCIFSYLTYYGVDFMHKALKQVHVQKSSINTLCMLVNTLIEKIVSKIKFHLCIKTTNINFDRCSLTSVLTHKVYGWSCHWTQSKIINCKLGVEQTTLNQQQVHANWLVYMLPFVCTLIEL